MNKNVKRFLIVVFFLFAYNLISNFSYYKRQYQSIRRNAQWEQSELVGQTIDGLKQGEWKSHFSNGQLAEVKNYTNDTLNGEHIAYTPEGKFSLIEKYYMGVQVDTFKLYSGGELNILEYRDSAGLRQGELRVYVDNSLSQEGYYLNNKMHGEWRTYDLKSHYLNQVYEYTNGEKSGIWIYLNETGDTTKIEEY